MSWLFSRALVEAFSADTCSAGAQSALSSGTPTPQAFCAPDRMTAFSRPSRFGMTFGPLTDDLGAVVLTWCLGDSLARTLASPARATASTESAADCGPKWRGSLARYDHDSRSWRTAQHSLLGGSDEFSETWPRWGTTVGGELFLLPMPALPTAANESGSWPTPIANDAQKRGAARVGAGLPGAVEQSTAAGMLNPTWVEWLMGWPLGWTDLQPSATDKYRTLLRSPGDCSEVA